MTDKDAFQASDEEKALIKKLLGDDAIVDPQYKAQVDLTKEQAETRVKLIEDVEYDFSLGLRKGKYYLGHATINFYLKEMPADNQLFLSS